MKTGKVSEAVLKRSVLKSFEKEKLTASGTAFGEDVGFFEGKGVAASASVCGSLTGPFDRTLTMLIVSAANNLWTAGIRPSAVILNLMLPEQFEEAKLQQLSREAAAICKTQQMIIAGGHTEVSSSVQRPVAAVTVLGTMAETKDIAAAVMDTTAETKDIAAAVTVQGMMAGTKDIAATVMDRTAVNEDFQKDRENSFGIRKMTSDLQPGQDLVMTGWIGLAGTSILAVNHEAELLKRYPGLLVDEAKRFDRWISINQAAKTGIRFGAAALHDVSQGGVFGALWEMASCAGVGIEVDLKKIPVRQETIEITDYFGINPYQLYGQGALLLGTEQGDALAEALQQAGISAAVIGHTTAANDRIIRNGEDIRFLERPQQDELWRLAEQSEA